MSWQKKKRVKKESKTDGKIPAHPRTEWNTPESAIWKCDKELMTPTTTEMLEGTVETAIPALQREQALIEWTCKGCFRRIGPISHRPPVACPTSCSGCGCTKFLYTYVDSVETSPLLIVDVGDMGCACVLVPHIEWEVGATVRLPVRVVEPRRALGATVWQYGWPIEETHYAVHPYQLLRPARTLHDQLDHIWELNKQEEEKEKHEEKYRSIQLQYRRRPSKSASKGSSSSPP